MKWLKTILLTVGAVLVFTSIHAAPYLTVWADSSHTDCSARYSAIYSPFDIWIYVDCNDEPGIVCAEFQLFVGSDHLLIIGIDMNPAFSLQEGESPEAAGGVMICSAECQTDWVWLYKLNLLPTLVIVSYVQTGQTSPGGEFGVNSCEEGNPRVGTHIRPLSINQNGWCEMAVEVSSWGVIKNLFNE